MLTFAGIVFGILLLIGGGAALVRGASDVAAGFGVPPMVVGLTIVGFGTSSPELVVNIIGALEGATDVAFGNVVGSNITNLGLVLGIAAMLRPIDIQGDIVRRELPLLLLATTMTTVMALDSVLEGRPSVIGRADGIVLMLMFCIFVYVTVLDLLRVRAKDPLIVAIAESPVAVPKDKSRVGWLLIIAGFALLFIGGELTIRNAVAFAERLGVSSTIVGLFVVAIGTSMPELVTSVIAAIRKEADLALGNVIGSNIFNSLIVLPTSGLIVQVPVPDGGIADLVMSWLLAAALIPLFFLGRARLGRISGAVFVVVYFGYAVFRLAAS